MAIDIELSGLKAAGAYRFERDLSALSNSMSTEPYTNLRLIVGFSKRGPFNSAQLITSSSQFIKLYGNIDRSLEKRGSYFHRSALAALSVGPILCLNLLALDPENDQIMHRSISTNVKKSNKNICTIPFQTVYNTEKFWTLSTESYLDSVITFDNTADKDGIKSSNVLNFTNISDKPISVIVKKASEKNIKGYEVTLNEWFGAENVPDYLNGTSFVSDYMVEVYVIGGDFGPEMFNKIERANEKSSIITYEYDDAYHGAFNDNKPDNDVYSDITGAVHPYKRFASDLIYQEYFDRYGFKADKLNKFLSLPSVNIIASYVGSLLPDFVNKLNQNIWIENLINADTLTTGLLCVENIDMIESAEINEDSGIVNEAIDIIGHNLYKFVESNDYKNINFLSYGISQDRIDEIILDDIKYIGELGIHYPKSKNVYYIDKKGIPLNVEASNEIIIDKDDFINGKIKVGDLLLSEVVDVISGEDKTYSRLTRVVEITSLYRTSTDESGDSDFEYDKDGNVKYIEDTKHVRVVCSDKVLVSYELDANGKPNENKPYISKYASIDNICDRLHWTFLRGFKTNPNVMPDGTNERQNKILDMLSEDNPNSNLYNALIDRDYVQWRYVVDTFGLGIESECKKVYALLCKGRQSGLAIVNAPSMKDFKKSVDPSFIDNFGGVKSEHIANGGDLDKAPSNRFNLPKEENGASWAAYYYPYLKISDLASVKTVPPAAYISNLYISKYTSAKPWSIVAGPKRGVITGNQVIGLEGALTFSDREYLEPMGLNPIVWENGVGVEIFANKTAKQSPVSALSSIHAREVCVYIQDNVEAILKKYNWESNTARNRDEIKTMVDTFLAGVKSGDGVYAYKTVMDSTNNTTEVIDRNMGVIDIYIEVVKGLEILAQRLTVLKTGSIESGNFE